LFKAVLERECRISVRANGQPACCRQARSLTGRYLFFGLRHLHIFDLQDRLRPTRDPVIYQTNREESVMSSNYKLVFGVVLGAALGAAAVQGLHAQAKPKAYSVTETEVLDATAQAAYSPQVQAAQKAAGGRSFRTAGGRIVALEGAAAPKRVGLTEWDSLEQAEAFYKSKAWNDLAPQRDKAVKTIRRYAVEAMN
jgi:uncharacterized protein (DUF1330 family)